jgi:hypothetical protein
VVCLGGGPSLTAEDVAAVRGQRTIAINDAYRLAPWADVLYAADRSWIDAHDGVPGFAGMKYSIASHDPTPRPDWTVLQNTGIEGLERDPSGLRTGFNGGYQAINLAVHLGAARILLLGYDLGPDAERREHWFEDQPVRTVSPYPQMREAFQTLVLPLIACGVSVVNCSRRTALAAFACARLAEELRERAA